MDMMLPKVLSLEGTCMHLHERQLGKDTLEASQSCEWDVAKVALTL